jgi:toxin ParE1/3/4
VTHFFHPEAAAEFEEAVQFYKGRGRTLGDRFAAEVRTAIRRIIETPERWRVVDEDVRRCLVRVFPYSVLYTIERDYVLIVAVAHGRREPGYWKHRLQSKPPS